MYTGHVQAIKHALQHIRDHKAFSETEKLPQMVIDFIKKWVAKEKTLINHIVV